MSASGQPQSPRFGFRDLGLGLHNMYRIYICMYRYCQILSTTTIKKYLVKFNSHHQLSSKVLTFGQKHYPNIQFIFPLHFSFWISLSKSLQKIKTCIPLRINRKWDTQAYNKLFYVIKEQKNNETWDIECRPFRFRQVNCEIKKIKNHLCFLIKEGCEALS